MASRDGSGPNGEGPRTGRGLGNCPPKVGLQSMFPLAKRYFGRGLRRGRRFGRRGR